MLPESFGYSGKGTQQHPQKKNVVFMLLSVPNPLWEDNMGFSFLDFVVFARIKKKARIDGIDGVGSVDSLENADNYLAIMPTWRA